MKKIVNTILSCMLIASCMTISPLKAEEQADSIDVCLVFWIITDEYGFKSGDIEAAGWYQQKVESVSTERGRIYCSFYRIS
ncbi:MAG: hypothetical protein ACLTDX_04830 [[Clostridium] innocuum]